MRTVVAAVLVSGSGVGLRRCAGRRPGADQAERSGRAHAAYRARQSERGRHGAEARRQSGGDPRRSAGGSTSCRTTAKRSSGSSASCTLTSISASPPTFPRGGARSGVAGLGCRRLRRGCGSGTPGSAGDRAGGVLAGVRCAGRRRTIRRPFPGFESFLSHLPEQPDRRERAVLAGRSALREGRVRPGRQVLPVRWASAGPTPASRRMRC